MKTLVEKAQSSLTLNLKETIKIPKGDIFHSVVCSCQRVRNNKRLDGAVADLNFVHLIRSIELSIEFIK